MRAVAKIYPDIRPDEPLSGLLGARCSPRRVRTTSRRSRVTARPSTVKAADSALRIFSEWLIDHDPTVIALRQINRRHIEAFELWLATRENQRGEPFEEIDDPSATVDAARRVRTTHRMGPPRHAAQEPDHVDRPAQDGRAVAEVPRRRRVVALSPMTETARPPMSTAASAAARSFLSFMETLGLRWKGGPPAPGAGAPPIQKCRPGAKCASRAAWSVRWLWPLAGLVAMRRTVAIERSLIPVSMFVARRSRCAHTHRRCAMPSDRVARDAARYRRTSAVSTNSFGYDESHTRRPVRNLGTREPSSTNYVCSSDATASARALSVSLTRPL